MPDSKHVIVAQSQSSNCNTVLQKAILATLSFGFVGYIISCIIPVQRITFLKTLSIVFLSCPIKGVSSYFSYQFYKRFLLQTLNNLVGK